MLKSLFLFVVSPILVLSSPQESTTSNSSELDAEPLGNSSIQDVLSPTETVDSSSQDERGYVLDPDSDSSDSVSWMNETNSTRSLSFDVLNGTFEINTTDVYTIHLNSSNDLALSILAGETTNNHTGNETLDALVNQGRELLGSPWKPKDLAQYGTYIVINCGSQNGQSSRNIQAIGDSIQRIQLNLIPVISDIDTKGARSIYGFKSLFKTNRKRYIKAIKQVYGKILTGASVPWRPANLKDGGKSPGSLQSLPPQIVCLRDDINDRVSSDGFQTCLQQPDSSGIWWQGTTTVGLCPLWFHHKLGPTGADCPNFTNGVLPDVQWENDNLQRNRDAFLLHELVHMYTGHDTVVESYGLKQAMALNSGQQRANPANYAYFYGSVTANCTGWPGTITDHDGL